MLGLVAVEADGVWVVVVSGAFWVAVDEVVGDCDVVGAVVGELGDWANAEVANTRPTAVLIKKRVFILCPPGCGPPKTIHGPRGSTRENAVSRMTEFARCAFRFLARRPAIGNIRPSDGLACTVIIGGVVS